MATPHRLALGWGSFAFGGVAVLTWMVLGEPWEILADGAHYLRMAEGQPVEVPFGYRPLVPWLAALGVRTLPLGPEAVFALVAAVALALATVLYARLGARHGGVMRGVVLAGLWATSFGFAYGATAGARADPVLLLAVVAIVTVGRAGPGWVLVAIAVVGVLAHEMALYGLLALGVERAFRASLFGRDAGGVAWERWAVALAGALVAIGATRLILPVLPASIPNWTGTPPLVLAAQAVEYAGGPVPYVSRVYAAFGPAALYALAVLPDLSRRERATAVVLVLAAIGLSLLATDTLRVMALASIVVLPLAARFLVHLGEEGRWGLMGTALGVQVAFSVAVYGHLRSFEASAVLQAMAAALSGVALWILVVARRGATERR